MNSKKEPGPRGDGYFYRRFKQKYYSIDSAVPGTIYYCLRSDNERLRICCHTKDLRIAKRLVETHLGGVNLSTDQRFLDTIAKAGEKAKKRLEADISSKPRRRE